MPAPTFASFTVPSRTRTNVDHTVTFDGRDWACSCEWGQRRRTEQRQCWHVEAVIDAAVREFAWRYEGTSSPDSIHRDYYLRQIERLFLARQQQRAA